MEDFKDKMFTLLTFSSPHVGYFLKNISLFHLGLKATRANPVMSLPDVF